MTFTLHTASSIVGEFRYRLRDGALALLNACRTVGDLFRGVVAFTLASLRGMVKMVVGAAALSITAMTAGVPLAVRLALLGLQLTLITSPLLIATFFIVCALANPFVREELDYAHDRSSAAEVFDADGRWIGIVPPASLADWSDGSVLPPDHAAVPPISIPPVWRTCIAYLEDRSAFDGISSWLGFNPVAMVKAGVQTVFFQRRRGASTLNMQVVRTLNGQSPSSDEPVGAVALRKLAELVGATALAGMLHEHDPELSERYIGMHLPLVIGAAGSGFGDPIYGIELAARILFGQSANALLPEQQAILAAAVKTPVVLAPPSDEKGQTLALARWKRVKARSDYCLSNAFIADSIGIADARRRLVDLPLPMPSLDPKIAELLPADRREAWRITVNPARRSLYFAGPELRVAKTELDRTFESNWRGRLVAVHLTTSATDSRVFEESISSGLQQLQTSVAGLSLDLTDSGSTTAAQVVVALADDKGHLRGLYSSHEGLFLGRQTEIGSTAKMIAALVLSRHNTPSTLYCQAPIPGMAVTAVDDQAACRAKSRWLSARDAFARSNSPAVNWALRHYSNHSEMEMAAATFGLPPFGDVPAATALSLGIVQLTPAEMLRMTAALGNVIAGDRVADVAFPTVISDVAVLGTDGVTRRQLVAGGEPLRGDALQSVVPVRAKPFLANVLAATSDPGGTLSSLSSLKTELGGMLFAKTGTVSVKGDTQAIQIAGIFIRAGHPWSFSIVIAGPDNAHPLGRKLLASEFARLVKLLVRPSLSGANKNDLGFRYAGGDHARHDER